MGDWGRGGTCNHLLNERVAGGELLAAFAAGNDVACQIDR